MKFARLSILMLLLLTVAGPASADTLNYGIIVGADYTYIDVMEDSLTDPVPLFNIPTISNNNLKFNPIAFSSSTSDGDLDMTDSQASFGVIAHAGRKITTVALHENGTYLLSGDGTADTWVNISAPVWLQVRAINGVSIDPITMFANMNIAPSDTYALTIDAPQGQWQASLLLDVTAFLRSSGKSGYATEIWMTWDNVLLSVSEPGTSAEINKIEAEVIIPEPATLSILAVGAAVISAFRCRKMKSKVVSSLTER